MITEELMREIDIRAGAVARKYHLTCPWVEFAELRQEAWLHALEALPRYDPARGTPLLGYLNSVMVIRCGDLVSKVRAPISASRKARRQGHVRGVVAEGLEAPAGMDQGEALSGEPRRELATPAEQWPEQKLGTREWNRRTVARMLEILSEQPMGDLAEAVLLDGWRSCDLAVQKGVHEWRVNRATRQARKAIRYDDEMVELYQAQLNERA